MAAADTICRKDVHRRQARPLRSFHFAGDLRSAYDRLFFRTFSRHGNRGNVEDAYGDVTPLDLFELRAQPVRKMHAALLYADKADGGGALVFSMISWPSG